MSISTPSLTDNTEIWASLKQAISNSSAFQHWKSQLAALDAVSDLNLDDLVQRYLRETLETLAY
jgi:hypothetical protein